MSVARRTCYLKLHQATRSIRHRAQIINTCHSHVGLRSLTTDGASRPPLDEAEKLVRKVSSVARVKKSEGLAKHSSRQKAAIDKSRQQFSVFTSNAHATVSYVCHILFESSLLTSTLDKGECARRGWRVVEHSSTL